MLEAQRKSTEILAIAHEDGIEFLDTAIEITASFLRFDFLRIFLIGYHHQPSITYC